MDSDGSLIFAQITAVEVASDFTAIMNGVDAGIDILFPIASAVVLFGISSYVVMKFVYGR